MALSEEHKLRVINIAGMKMLSLIADDYEVAELAREYPDELTKMFLAGVQAGAEAMSAVLKDTLV